VEIVLINVILPLTKTVFTTMQTNFIASVSKTANVIRGNVKILSINELSGRSFGLISRRVLLATSVKVDTSILMEIGQRTDIRDLSVLNNNLKANGLPEGIFFQTQGYNTAFNGQTTPVPGSGASEFNLKIGAAVGGLTGFLILISAVFLKRNNQVTIFYFLSGRVTSNILLFIQCSVMNYQVLLCLRSSLQRQETEGGAGLATAGPASFVTIAPTVS
jgi:hypothetical protein